MQPEAVKNSRNAILTTDRENDALHYRPPELPFYRLFAVILI